jgi:hypothetical protein
MKSRDERVENPSPFAWALIWVHKGDAKRKIQYTSDT